MPISIAILVSGRGSNMQAILDAVRAGQLDVKVSLVVSNNPEAPALDLARQYGVQALCVPSKGKSRQQHELEMLFHLSQHQIDFVVLAGYMRVLTSGFLQPFPHSAGYYKVINIHPSLLPDFPGANAYEEAFNNGVAVSGVTIHLVDEQVDHGPILAQVSFARLESDTLESFKNRGLSIEHSLYPKVLQQISRDGVEALLSAARNETSCSLGEVR